MTDQTTNRLGPHPPWQKAPRRLAPEPSWFRFRQLPDKSKAKQHTKHRPGEPGLDRDGQGGRPPDRRGLPPPAQRGAPARPAPPLPPSRTVWTRLVPPSVPTGHVSSDDFALKPKPRSSNWLIPQTNLSSEPAQRGRRRLSARATARRQGHGDESPSGDGSANEGGRPRSSAAADGRAAGPSGAHARKPLAGKRGAEPACVPAPHPCVPRAARSRRRRRLTAAAGAAGGAAARGRAAVGVSGCGASRQLCPQVPDTCPSRPRLQPPSTSRRRGRGGARAAPRRRGPRAATRVRRRRGSSPRCRAAAGGKLRARDEASRLCRTATRRSCIARPRMATGAARRCLQNRLCRASAPRPAGSLPSSCVRRRSPAGARRCMRRRARAS